MTDLQGVAMHNQSIIVRVKTVVTRLNPYRYNRNYIRCTSFVYILQTISQKEVYFCTLHLYYKILCIYMKY